MDLFNEPSETRGAVFNEARTHRYYLCRIWDHDKPKALFIGLNPSKADSKEDDPTIKSVRRIAHFNGYGGFYMGNCFTYISTNPDHLQHTHGEQALNDLYLNQFVYSGAVKDVVFAWGNFDIVRKTERDKELISLFPGALCIGKNKNGSPKHPLYCKSDSIFIPYIASQIPAH